VHAIFEFVSMIAETFIYLYIGLQVVAFEHVWSAGVSIVALVVVFFARCANVFPFMNIANCFRPADRKFRFGMQIVMWLSGLRGAIAFILAILVEDKTPHGSIIVSTTLIVCLVTTIAGGGAVLAVLKPLKLILPGNPADFMHEDEHDQVDAATLTGFNKFDHRWFKPILIRDYRNRRNNAPLAESADHDEAHADEPPPYDTMPVDNDASFKPRDDDAGFNTASASAGANGEFDAVPLEVIPVEPTSIKPASAPHSDVEGVD